MKKFILNNFWNGYTIGEKIFMWTMVALQIIVFCINPDTPLNIICGLAGVISTVMCAKGKFNFYTIGFIQTTTYLLLAFQNKFYGEVIENIFYLITMIWGMFIWNKNMIENENGTKDIKSEKFTFIQWIISIILTLILTIGFGFILDKIGSSQPYTDAATNVLAVFAQLMMVKRYREQWLWWFIIDILCMKLWFVAGNMSMFVMYIAWTINCVYGWFNWSLLNKKQKNNKLKLQKI